MELLKDPTNFLNGNNLDKHFTERKISGSSRWDCWNLSQYLSWVIANGLIKMKENMHGYPPDLSWEEWNLIIDHMIMGFQAHIDLMDVTYSGLESEKDLQRKQEEGLQLFVKYFDHLWD